VSKFIYCPKCGDQDITVNCSADISFRFDDSGIPEVHNGVISYDFNEDAPAICSDCEFDAPFTAFQHIAPFGTVQEPPKAEFRIKWQQCPRCDHASRIMFVEADSAETAQAIAGDHIERTFGIGWFVIDKVEAYVRPTGGHIKE